MGLMFVAVALVACSSDDKSESNDPTVACKDLCTASGFSSSRLDNQPNELNCFCSGGTGTVTAAACTNTCTSAGKKTAQPFKSSGGAFDSCQCS
jgi:hypothetical protein